MSISDNFTSHRTRFPYMNAPHSILAAIAVASFGALFGTTGLTPAAVAQVAIKRAIPEDQVVAMHSVLRRQRPTAPAEIATAAQGDSFNNDQGPGTRPDRTRAGMRPVPRSCFSRLFRGAFVLWPTTVVSKPKPGRPCSVAQHWTTRCHQGNHHPAAVPGPYERDKQKCVVHLDRRRRLQRRCRVGPEFLRQDDIHGERFPNGQL